MRLLLATVFAVSPAGVSGDPSCNRPLPTAPAGLPSRVLVTTQCGTYGVDPDGRVAVAKPKPFEKSPWRVALRGGHLVLIEHGRAVWRSRRTFGREIGSIQSIAVGRRALAFSFDDRRLWVSRLAGKEHVVARGEAALGWTAHDELVTLIWSRHTPYRGTLFVRGPDGTYRRHLASRVVGTEFEDSAGILIYTTADGLLSRTDGATVTRLADLIAYGIDPTAAWPELLDGGLIAFQGRDRIVVLHPDGTLFGSAGFGGSAPVNWRSWPAAGAPGVAFVVGDPDGHESVYLLRDADTRARLLFRAMADLNPCGGGAASWHGNWLLYANQQGNVAALEATGAHAPVLLTDTAARLPGVDGEPGWLTGFSDAAWS